MQQISIGRYRGGLCVSWTDPSSGKRRRFKLAARTRADAEAEALIVYRREGFGRHHPTVSEIWEAYRQDLGDRPTARTMRSTGSAVLSYFGRLRPHQISRDLCRDYDRRRRAAGRSQGTVHTELGHLRSALVFARKTGLVTEAPSIWRPAKPSADRRILSRDEAAALLAATREPHVRLAVVLLLGTAARIGAVLDLTWDRVDFAGGAIDFRLPDTATRKGRAIVPLNAMTRPALERASELALTRHVIEYGLRPVASIRRGFSGAVERSGIGPLRIHDLRHTAAVTMLGAGAPMELVSQVLGHSDTSVTASVYGRYRPEHLSRGVDHLAF